MTEGAAGCGASPRALLLGAVALGSSLATLASILSYQHIARRARRRALAERVKHDAQIESSSLPDLPAQAPESTASSVHEDAAPPSGIAFDDSLIREQLSRNYSFLGEEGMAAVRRSFVVVVGAGGVGSWAALMLLRSGVSHIRLIDFDQVSLSSLNRHACATLADVGRPKVVCCAQFFQKIAPWARVEACVDLFRADAADRLLDGRPTYVVDAIDNLETKVDLLSYCYKHDLRVFSSMGAGAKADPSRIQISDISTTVEDPLARVVRRELRAAGVPPIPGVISEPAKDPGAKKEGKNAAKGAGAKKGGTKPDQPPARPQRSTSGTSDTSDAFRTPESSPERPSKPQAPVRAPPAPQYTEDDFYQEWKVPCVYSTEKSDVRLLPLSEEEMEKGDVAELAAFDDFRVRILPVLGPLPAMFGLAAATYILCDLAHHRMEPLAVKGRRKLYEKLFADLNVTESRYPSPPPDETHRAPANRKPLTDDDIPPTYRASAPSEKGPPPKVRIPFSVNDCAYVFEEMFRGRTVVPPFETLATGQLMRWDPTRPLDYNNVVLFSRKQAREHEQVLKEKSDPAAFWGPKVTAMVQRRMAEEKRMSHWR
ncbi:hypothetical protein MOBT1_000933 [Malassezia obtusa]|uniref:THIF-type NAD/FAD binding fold domain-containing protein n=1 Tax=Malassezia obtusa TaxID=76774 RepID=A0AAF0IRA4_9BASI|nr:hypothetical protein MOBT1_000933 [Malassezia obtusa]